jgi:hypothetical protein
MRGRSSVRRCRLSNAFAMLAGVLTERGDLDGALEAARDSVSLIEQDAANDAWNVMDYFALRAACAGKVENAARVAGYVDICFVAKGATREPNEARARATLQALLNKRLDPLTAKTAPTVRSPRRGRQKS